MIDNMQHMLQIIPIPAFKDNYIWLLHNGIYAIVVDPGDANPVITALSDLNLQLAGILITHHHSDHIGGVDELLTRFPDISIYAPKQERYSFRHIAVSEPNQVNLPELGLSLNVIDLPGHTLGHIAYYAEGLLFCGDTLFGAGCGRLFEGTAEQLYHSLQKLAQLPADTKVYCTHEYTLHNIRFALTLEPANHALQQRKYDTEVLRDAALPSLPSNIKLELDTNPFLRCFSAEIRSTVQLETATETEIFRTIREMRNHY